MSALLLLFSTSFAATLAITPVLRRVALRFGWVDLPDARKIHSGPIPRVGGVGVFIAYLTALGLLSFTSLKTGGPVTESLQLAWRLLPSAAVVFATGLLDDRLGLRPWQKLLGQLAGAVLACMAGVRIEGVVGHFVDPWAGVPLTLLWLVACTNAFNLIDGVDGLAAGVGLFATLTTLVAGLLHGDFALALATAPLAGALAGFLPLNFKPAKVFLGDGGSLTVGFLLGCYSVIWSQKCATILGMTAPLMALAVPICDTAVAIARRFVSAKPIFGADRAHIHHRLLDLGLTPRRVVVLLYLASGLAACLALLQSFVSNEMRGLILFVFCAAAWLGIRRLGYEEFRAVAGLLRFKLVRGLIDDQLRLRSLEESLTAALTAEDCWLALRNSAREFGFSSVALHMSGHTYEESFRESSNHQWSVRVPLPGFDYMSLTREYDSPQTILALATLVDFLYHVLAQHGRYIQVPRHLSAAAATGGADPYQSATALHTAANPEA